MGARVTGADASGHIVGPHGNDRAFSGVISGTMTGLLTTNALQEFVLSRLDAVQATLDDHVITATAELPHAGPHYRNLWQTLGNQFGGGKNLRPSLALAAYAGLGGEHDEAILLVAAAMEMLH